MLKTCCTNTYSHDDNENLINITFISDTHEQHRKITKDLQKGDIIIHTGDFSNGECDENDMKRIQKFLCWFSKLPYQHKIFIGGNHDFAIKNIDKFNKLLSMYPGVTYLHQSSIEIPIKNITLKFYGIPYITYLLGWMFYLNDVEQQQSAQQIEQCDILLTHDVPYHSQHLQNRINEIQPIIHAYGHMHGHWGICQKNGVTYVNGAQMGFPGYSYIYKPIRIHITQNKTVILPDQEKIKIWEDFPIKK
ncbi:Calcineurin-like_phosphoesterase [Hexamita inflata]|uniref:Calcineurin-like phosphoesterase n=1 Tax=Hexamita inflata TaxID=28002 RepID=A0AA86UE24_9EUKA|nr:Calcineurin-like phosphoesterase [Hexamita inflata]